MNKSIFMGRLTRDPETRYGQNGNAVSSFSLAVDRRFKRDDQPTADFFNMTAFGKTAEFCEKYLHKGTKVVVECEAQNDNYTDKNGNKVYSIKFIVNNIEFAESKSASDQGNNEPPVNQTADDDGFMNIPDGVDEELPFA